MDGVNTNYTGAAAASLYQQPATAAATAAETKKEDTAKTVDNQNNTASKAYVYEKSTEKTYKPDNKKVQEMMKESEEKVKAFRDMLEKIFLKQGTTMEEVLKRVGNGEDVKITVDDATAKAAQESISEDGYYGVKQTSERILDFAKAVSGGDPSKIEEIREAIQKGFEGAAKKFGKELPEISQQTYDAVMKGLDEWANGGKSDSAASDYAKDNFYNQAATSTLK